MNVKGKINYPGMANYRLYIDADDKEEYVYLDDIVDDLGWKGKEVSLNVINTGSHTVLMIVGPTEEQ